MDVEGFLPLAASLSISAELKICAAAVPSHKLNMKQCPLVRRLQLRPEHHKT